MPSSWSAVRRREFNPRLEKLKKRHTKKKASQLYVTLFCVVAILFILEVGLTPVRAIRVGAHPGATFLDFMLFGAVTISSLSVKCCAYLKCHNKCLNNTTLAFGQNGLYLLGKFKIP